MTNLLLPSEWPGFPKLEGPHDPWWPIQEAGWPIERELLPNVSLGYLPRRVVANFPGVRELIVAHPMWEIEPHTDDAYRRSSEFIAVREKAEARLHIQREEAASELRTAWEEMGPKLPLQAMGPNSASGPFGSPLTKATISGAKDDKHIPYQSVIAKWSKIMLMALGPQNGYPPEMMIWWRESPEINGQIEFGETDITWRVYCRYSVGLGPLA